MVPMFTIKEFSFRYMYLKLFFGEIFHTVLNMDCILTRVAILVYVVRCVSVFVLFPSHSENMTVKSDIKISDCRKHWEKLESFLKFKTWLIALLLTIFVYFRHYNSPFILGNFKRIATKVSPYLKVNLTFLSKEQNLNIYNMGI